MIDVGNIRDDVYVVFIERELGPFLDYYLDSDDYIVDEKTKDEMISNETTPRYKYYNHAGFWLKFRGNDTLKLMNVVKFQTMFLKEFQWGVTDVWIQKRINRLMNEQQEEADFAFAFYYSLLVYDDITEDEDMKKFSKIECLRDDTGIYQIDFRVGDEIVFSLVQKTVFDLEVLEEEEEEPTDVEDQGS